MTLKKSSIIFLLVLFIVLVFIIGVRRGQQVEKTNKVINFLISIPPSATLQPTQIALEFKTYENKSCGIKFLYPNDMEILKKASESAALTNRQTTNISFHCDKDSEKFYNFIHILNNPNMEAEEIKFQNKSLAAKLVDIQNGQQYIFSIKHPANKKIIYFGITKTLLPFFEKTLEFLR